MNDDRVQKLWAIEQIRQLAYSYAYAVDTLDWDLMESLWVKTKEPEPFPLLDIHAMRRLSEKFADQGASMLMVANHRVRFQDDRRASGTVYCYASVDRGYLLEQTIIYVDDYERHDDVWLFRRRNHLLMWGRKAAENPMRQNAANWPLSQVGAGTAAATLRGAHVATTEP